MNEDERTVWTVGHSNRSLGEFLGLLAGNGIEVVADVRRYAGSRKHPQFNPEALGHSLAQEGVTYVPLPELGGRRTPRPDSRNTLWKDESFRGYADYMGTEAFHAGIERLLGMIPQRRTAIMCAEALWWRCHRSLIADYLKADGVCVRHILSARKNEIHPYSPAARLVDGRLSYSPDDEGNAGLLRFPSGSGIAGPDEIPGWYLSSTSLDCRGRSDDE